MSTPTRLQSELDVAAKDTNQSEEVEQEIGEDFYVLDSPKVCVRTRVRGRVCGNGQGMRGLSLGERNCHGLV